MKQFKYSNSEQSWPSFVNQTPRLQLNTLDFSDLWDEEDLDLGIADDDPFQSNVLPRLNPGHRLNPPAPPPAPPLAPPPPPSPQVNPVALGSGRRTLKLHWKELLSLQPLPRVSRFGSQCIWAALEPVHLDTNRLEYLFESKSSSNKALSALKGGTQNPLCVSVLGVKRSNIITIALSSLPPPHLLPPAIYNMDSSVLDREDVQRLQSLVPSEEELKLIKEAKAQAPRCPLALAEQCLLTLGSITHLSSRLQLWAFALDYDTLEKEIAEPLFHLKLAMEQLATNQTFHYILATVLAIGNCLNGCKARGFELSYLGKLSQVRDTHSRQPLLHHVCVLLLQLYPQSSDLYSNITAVTRASKCDYLQVQSSLSALESLCKASWEQLHMLNKEGTKKGAGRGEGDEQRGISEACLYQRLPQFLKECNERLKVLRAVHRRVVNRFHSFLLYLGYSRSMVRETNADAFCKTVSDFALEYRTAHHAILQQRERDREREEREKEEKMRKTSASTAKAKAIESPAPNCMEQSMLEEVLNTPTSPSCFDLSLPRHRSRTPNTRGLFCRLLSTKIEVVKEIVQHATDNTQPMSMLSNELQTS
ncbi:FH1/FH2 domain-containing protein 1 isoform X2 [Ictalurus furcatus]|uniref:FH1/FH2 domain-containing protein 1 isoform X2 n=1 Tax=Ictalurus furcatus TaxID=66913 RepID=UPI00234FFCF4|nr:FH1/FH2 domain-containing protein 1 isoform X2 [Ictalurus furcatus]